MSFPTLGGPYRSPKLFLKYSEAIPIFILLLALPLPEAGCESRADPTGGAPNFFLKSLKIMPTLVACIQNPYKITSPELIVVYC